jgi:hypothetical protein
MDKKGGEEFKSVEDILGKNIKEGNISLILDGYDDIFSDFDPRPYSERALSDDFLSECKKASRDKEEKLELRVMVPGNKRNYKDELKIRKRLKNHFQRHYVENQDEIKKMKREGANWFIVGVCLMLLSTFLYGNQGFIYKLLEVMLVPAAWFMFWEGLDKIFISSREKEPDYEFYKKMAHCQIYFLSY